MKKITIILVLMFAVVSLSGYRAMAVEDLVDDFTVTQFDTETCPMLRDGTGEGTRLRDGTGYGSRMGSRMGSRTGSRMGQMMNRTDRDFQNRDNTQIPREDCPFHDAAEELE